MKGHVPFSLRSGQKRKQKRSTELTWVRTYVSQSQSRRAAGYFVSAAFFAAQRFLAASAIRWRPSGLSFLFFLADFVAAGATAAAFLGAATTFLGLPSAFFGAVAAPPPSRVRACCNWAISRSMLARISEIAMYYSP